MTYPEFLSTQELAQRLKVSVATIDNWRREQIIPSKKLGGKRFYIWSEVLDAINTSSCAQSA